MENCNLYFGCVGQVGHYLYMPGDRGPVQPHGMESRRLAWASICDGGLMDANREEQVEGAATWSHVKGYSIVSFWDRSVDSRFASSSSFLVYGVVSFDQVLDISRKMFPTIFERFKFEIVAYLPKVMRVELQW